MTVIMSLLISFPNCENGLLCLIKSVEFEDILVDKDGNFRKLSVYDAMQQIYNKYITDNAMYVINISGQMRLKLKQIFASSANDKEKDDISDVSLLNIYDECAVDILWTLHDASHRFQSTDSFQTFRDHITEQNEDDIMVNNNSTYSGLL